jgi:HEPN domain-containing protein
MGKKSANRVLKVKNYYYDWRFLKGHSMVRADDAIAKKWIAQALHDLDMADRNLSIEGYDVAAYLSHQAVEKLLKGIIAMKGERIPKSHYIDELGKSLNLPDHILEYLYDLSVDYQLARYPDMSDIIPYKHYTKPIAQQKVKYAQYIFEFLEDTYRSLED